jgi:hypothetical protein
MIRAQRARIRNILCDMQSMQASFAAPSETVKNYCIEGGSYTWFLEKAVIKVNGKVIPEEAKIPLLLSMNIF